MSAQTPREAAIDMAYAAGGPQRGWIPSGRCLIFVCDIVSFGDRNRTDHIQRHLREELYKRLRRAFDDSGVPFGGCYSEDRGDGAIVIPPPGTPVATLISPLAERLHAEFRRQNEVASSVARIRLRLALHAGEVHSDDHGIAGTAVNHTFRILEAPRFKRTVTDSGARLALIVSQHLYDEVVRHATGLIDPEDYEQVDVESKETSTTGWMRLLGVPRGDSVRPDGGRPEQQGSEIALPGETPLAVRPPAPAHPGADVRADGRAAQRLSPGGLFQIVEQLLEVQLMTTAAGRDQVINTLREDIGRMVPRQAAARMDTYCLVQTCLEHPGGIQELLVVLRGFVGQSETLLRLEQTVSHHLG